MALKFGRSASEGVYREALAGGRERKDLKWRSVVAGIAATALAAGAWLGISNSNGKSTEAIQPPEDTVTTSAQYEPTDAVAAATSNKEKVEGLLAAESSISLRERSDVARELGNSILDSLGNAENNLAYYPGTAADVRTSAEFNQKTPRADFIVPTELDYNTGELNPGDQQGGLYVSLTRKADGSGSLTFSSTEGKYFGNNNMQDTNYAIEVGVTPEAMDAAAKDGIFNMDDVENMLSDENTLLTGVRTNETYSNGVEIEMHNRSISIDPTGKISARDYASKFNPDSDESRVTTESVRVLATKVDLANAVNNAKNSFDRQAAK